MTGAELKTIRESLNLSAKELADRLGVASDRTIRRWESAEGRPVPVGVAGAVRIWDAAVDEAVARSIPDSTGHPFNHAICLARHEQGPFPGDALPHSRRLHHAYLARLRRLLEARGVVVTIEYQ